MVHNECPEPQPECKYFTTGCFADIDHVYFPACDYTTPVEKRFRQLPVNKRVLCRMLHEARHATESPPLKPSREFMLGVIATETGKHNKL